MSAPNDTKEQNHASPDYEDPGRNVANQKQPVTLPTTKARQGIMLGEMRYVLTIGIALAVLVLGLAYYYFVVA